MIRIITLVTKLIAATLLASLFSSCKFSADFDGFGKSVKGSGNVTTEIRTISQPFTCIEASNGLDIVVEQSNEIMVEVIADDNLQKEISTKVENGVLKITCTYSSFNNVKEHKVHVKMPKIDSLKAATGANIKALNTLKGNAINVELSTAAEMDLELSYETIKSTCSSGSSLTVSGKALRFDGNASSGSDVDGENLLANEIMATASSGGEMTVHPILSLVAEASSGADISYTAVPKSLKKL